MQFCNLPQPDLYARRLVIGGNLIYRDKHHKPRYVNLPFLLTGFLNSERFPFGIAAGDVRGPTGDDSASNPVTLAVPFTFIGIEYNRIYVRICVY